MREQKTTSDVREINYTQSQQVLVQLRKRIIIFGCSVGVLAMLVALPLQVRVSYNALIIIQDLVVLGSFSIVLFLVIRRGVSIWHMRVVAVVALGSFVINILTGASNGLGIYWVFLFPMAMHVLFAAREAIIWCAVFISFTLSLTIASINHQVLPHYGVQELWTSTVVLTIFSVINYFRQRFTEKGRDALLQAEQALQRDQEELRKFQMAANNAYDHIVITDPEGIVLYANAAATRITGYAHDEIVGSKAGKLWSLPMPNNFYERLWSTIKTKKKNFTGELRNRRKNGEVYYASAAISPILDAQGKVKFFLGIERDVTEQKVFQDKLAHEKAEYEKLYRRFDLATDAAHIGVGEWDIRTNAFDMDDEMLKLYGRKRKDFNGTMESWKQGIHPDDQQRVQQELLATMSSTKIFSSVYRTLWPNGEVRYLRAYAMIEHDTEGHPIRMVGVNWDITHEYLVDQAKSEFVSLASHQLRTPLSAINWYTEMLLNGDAGKPTKTQKEYLQEVYHGSQRMVELVNALLNVSRIDLGTFAIEPKPAKLQDVARIALKDLEPKIREKQLQMHIDVPNALPAVALDVKLMIIILQNLLSNAVKYTPEKGTVTLRIERNTKQIVIEVQDTGYGIAPKDTKSIFKKLFRADNIRDKVPDGTGLGLYLVKNVLEQSGGGISFTSELGKGTTFRATLPAAGMRAKAGTKGLTA